MIMGEGETKKEDRRKFGRERTREKVRQRKPIGKIEAEKEQVRK